MHACSGFAQFICHSFCFTEIGLVLFPVLPVLSSVLTNPISDRILVFMIDDNELRMHLVEVGRRLYEKGYIAGADGNFSARVDRTQIMITPSGLPKGRLTEDQLVLLRSDGRPLSGGPKPSSEYRMHLLLYEKIPSIGAVVHAHPPFTTALAATDREFRLDLLPEGLQALSDLAVVDYATPGSEELPEKIASYLPQARILVLRNHGVTAVGEDLEEAYLRLEACEHYSRICFLANLAGKPRYLSSSEQDKLRDLL
jgi:L-fuculose-phosphate aldolase